MEDWKLNDPGVQKAIDEFIRNARIAAETPDGRGGVLGFAAMTTILACILAVGEALLGPPKKKEFHTTHSILEEFYKHMEDKRSWIFPPEGVALTDEETLKILKGIRHGFAHSLTMPYGVELLPNKESEKRRHEDPYDVAEHLDAITKPIRWRIVVPLFIDAVEAAVKKASQDHPDTVWDPAKRLIVRGPVATTGGGGSVAGVITGGSTSTPPLTFRNTLGAEDPFD